MKYHIKFPTGRITNETWGGSLSQGRYDWLQKNPPAMWRWVLYFLFILPHPYTKYLD